MAGYATAKNYSARSQVPLNSVGKKIALRCLEKTHLPILLSSSPNGNSWLEEHSLTTSEKRHTGVERKDQRIILVTNQWVCSVQNYYFEKQGFEVLTARNEAYELAYPQAAAGKYASVTAMIGYCC